MVKWLGLSFRSSKVQSSVGCSPFSVAVCIYVSMWFFVFTTEIHYFVYKSRFRGGNFQKLDAKLNWRGRIGQKMNSLMVGLMKLYLFPPKSTLDWEAFYCVIDKWEYRCWLWRCGVLVLFPGGILVCCFWSLDCEKEGGLKKNKQTWRGRRILNFTKTVPFPLNYFELLCFVCSTGL